MTPSRLASTVALTVSVIACSGADGAAGSTVGSGLGGNGGADGGGGFVPDEPPYEEAIVGGWDSCFYEAEAEVIPEGDLGGVAIHQNACDPDQIADYFAACLSVGSNPETCMSFLDEPTNDLCVACLVGGMGRSSLPVVIESPVFTMITLHGCQASVLGLPECAVPVTRLIFCVHSGCLGCGEDCVKDAQTTGICASTIPLPAGCAAVLEVSDFDPVCVGDATNFDEAFPILADHYCGAP